MNTKTDINWHIAVAEAIATLGLMHERLEVNDYDGEEEPFMEDCMTALEMLKALPVDRAAIKAARESGA